MKKVTRTSWWPGALTSAGFFLVAVTLLAVVEGGPCNGSLLSDIRLAIGSLIYPGADSSRGSGIETPLWLGCVDSVGGPPGVVVAFHVLLPMVSGAIGTYVGKGIDPNRGVTGTCIGQLLFVEILTGARDFMLASHAMALITALFVAASLAYAGGWLLKYCLPRRAETPATSRHP